MPVKHVIFTSQNSACERPAWRNWAVISITDVGTNDAQLNQGWLDVLRLGFDDIDHEIAGYVLMGDLHARAIIQFVMRMHDDKRCEGILVHCWAGVSRSAAVAKWIAERYKLRFPDGYEYANQHVYMLLREEYMIAGYWEK